MILAAISQNNLSIAIFLIHNNEKLKKEISISLIEQIKNFLKNSSRFELDKENNDHKCILDGNQSEVYYTENKKCDDNESLKNVPKKEFTSKNNKLFIKQHGHQLGSDTSNDDDISNDSDTSYDSDTSNDSDISDDDSLNESSSDENLHDMYFVKKKSSNLNGENNKAFDKQNSILNDEFNDEQVKTSIKCSSYIPMPLISNKSKSVETDAFFPRIYAPIPF